MYSSWEVLSEKFSREQKEVKLTLSISEKTVQGRQNSQHKGLKMVNLRTAKRPI